MCSNKVRKLEGTINNPGKITMQIRLLKNLYKLEMRCLTKNSACVRNHCINIFMHTTLSIIENYSVIENYQIGNFHVTYVMIFSFILVGLRISEVFLRNIQCNDFGQKCWFINQLSLMTDIIMRKITKIKNIVKEILGVFLT